MDILVEISPSSAPNSFSNISLNNSGGICTINFKFSKLLSVTRVFDETLFDLLTLANVVYAVDRWIERKQADDFWTRDFKITLPVHDQKQWQASQLKINQCLSFLTGDSWNIDYIKRKSPIVSHDQMNLPETTVHGDAVSLFSGGLDSLVGIINWLEENNSGTLVLVGHHDRRIHGPFSDQKKTLSVLKKYYPGRISEILISAGPNTGYDTTLRGRSFLFICLGLYVAHSIGERTPLLIPENGTMALNIPLTFSRVGSCSTRTVHPYYLQMLLEIFKSFGIMNFLTNPLGLQTKGEILTNCRNKSILEMAIPLTTSCSKRGHTRTWIRRNAGQCGYCIPCILRRAALHHIGKDNETYGLDICKGEININSTHTIADDFRAYITYINEDLSPDDIGLRLLNNGKLDLAHISEYVDVILRSREEVKTFIQDKSIKGIKSLIDF